MNILEWTRYEYFGMEQGSIFWHGSGVNILEWTRGKYFGKAKGRIFWNGLGVPHLLLRVARQGVDPGCEQVIHRDHELDGGQERGAGCHDARVSWGIEN